MTLKQLLKSKNLGEYFEAKNNAEKMNEIENRGLKQVMKSSVRQTQLNSEIKQVIKKEKEAVRCPKCKSTNVVFMQQDKKTFSVKKAVAGTLLIGGTVMGFLGEKGKKQWHCNDCSCIFETK
ncbi:hypothetical protein [Streptococcus dysgalactiae]|uniref:hypothetical protein n=1 Tax=Streptococcus dysgalactiae TaxID=1334 RepID=UPI0039F5FA9B